MSNTSIKVKHLKVKLQENTVLDDISFELKPNEHLAIVGESGSGKTILAKVLAGQHFHEGTIEIEADHISAKSIVFVEQRNHFRNLSNLSTFYYQQRFNSADAEDTATVEQELDVAAVKIIDNEKQRSEKTGEWLSRLGLQHRKQTPLIQLSNGEHKRLQLIKALLHEPKIIVLDQPFTGLDTGSRQELHQIINQLSAESTVIIVTNIKDFPSCITHVAHLSKGKLKNFCAKKDFKYEDIVAASFSSSQPLPPSKEQTDFTTAVKLVNVSVKYGEQTILQNVNWQVERGERWLVKGPNGAGKSTLLNLLTGDNPQAYANEIYLFDRKRGTGESIWDIKRRIGYISPELHWYFDKDTNCYGAVASGFFDTMGFYRHLTAEQQYSLVQWMAYFKLTTIQHKPLSILSSGQQRLVLLARALVKDPPLLILDEPCQGLDDQQTENFKTLIDELCIKMHKTLIYVSPYDREVPSCVDKKLELDNGVAVTGSFSKKQTEAA